MELLPFKEGLEASQVSSFRKKEKENSIKLAKQMYEKECSNDQPNISQEGEENLMEQYLKYYAKQNRSKRNRAAQKEIESKRLKKEESSLDYSSEGNNSSMKFF